MCYDRSMNLSKKKCAPCEDSAIKSLKRAEIVPYMKEVSQWQLAKNARKISRTWLLKDFVTAMKFVTRVATLAEKNGHHPDIMISYNKVTLDLFTHSINGLSENDFILAAKIDRLAK